jgi:hypothetical protein
MIEYFVESMAKSDCEDGETLSEISKHKHILKLLEEIKEFETVFPEYEIIEPDIYIGNVSYGNLTEDDILDEDKELIAEENLEERKAKPRHRRIIAIRIRRRKSRSDGNITDAKVLERKAKTKKITPTTFNVGFDNDGNLVNLDLRKPEIKPKSESRFKKLAGLKRFRRGKKSESTESASSEETSKASKLKGKFSKIGKLKNAIPHRGKNKEKKE